MTPDFHLPTADLAALRHSSRAFRDAELSLLRAEGPAIAYLRRHLGDAYAVVVNAGDQPLTWELALPLPGRGVEVVALRGSGAGERAAALVGSSLHVEVPGRDGVVLRVV